MNKKLVAIIEDDDVLRRGLKRFFDKEKYLVIDFENGEKATGIILKESPDLILCDYKLPGNNGLEILQELRHEGVKTPFLLMTGYYTDEVKLTAKEKGVVKTFEKPIDLNLLKDSCQKIIRKRW